MTHVGYIAAGYLVTASALAGYTWRLVRRSRDLARRLPHGAEDGSWR